MTGVQTSAGSVARRATGRALPRKEDDRLLKAQGEFGDDTPIAHLGYVAFVRSPYAHATITSIDVSEAEAVRGVVCTLTGPFTICTLARRRPFAAVPSLRI